MKKSLATYNDSAALSVGSDGQLCPRDEHRLSQHSKWLVILCKKFFGRVLFDKCTCKNS